MINEVVQASNRNVLNVFVVFCNNWGITVKPVTNLSVEIGIDEFEDNQGVWEIAQAYLDGLETGYDLRTAREN